MFDIPLVPHAFESIIWLVYWVIAIVVWRPVMGHIAWKSHQAELESTDYRVSRAAHKRGQPNGGDWFLGAFGALPASVFWPVYLFYRTEAKWITIGAESEARRSVREKKLEKVIEEEAEHTKELDQMLEDERERTRQLREEAEADKEGWDVVYRTPTTRKER